MSPEPQPEPASTHDDAGRSDDPLISILVPVKDEVESLEQLVNEVRESLERDETLRGAWQLIFIDDGSSDGSWNLMQKLAEEDAAVTALRFRRNRGKSAALSAALSVARGKLIATMDGDLQDDPAEIPGMVQRLFDEDVDRGVSHF